MFEKQSEKIVNILIENNKIELEQKEIIKYGIHAFLSIVINTLLLICVGMILNMLLEATVLLLGFSCLRSYAGGYHCKTEMGCLILSNCIFAMILVISVLTPDDVRENVWLLVLSIGVVIMVRFAPVESEHKQLDATEFSVYKKRVRILLIIETGTIFTLKYFQLIELAYILSLGIFMLGMMVWMQKKISWRIHRIN